MAASVRSCTSMHQKRARMIASIAVLTIANRLIKNVGNKASLPYLQRLIYSVRDAIRTRDLPLRRRTLYPAELRKHVTAACPFAFADPGKNAPAVQWCYYNAFSRISVLQSPSSIADPSARSGIFPAAPSPVPHGAPYPGTFSCRQGYGFPPPCFPPVEKWHSRS